MHTASSAKRTWRLSASAVEYTATVLMPISLQVRITRRAISPRLAIRIFLNMVRIDAGLPSGRFHEEERLVVFDRTVVVDQNLHDPSGDFTLDFIEQLHGLDHTNGVALLHN